jgi:predicted RNA-binding Zn ribbon-like protein
MKDSQITRTKDGYAWDITGNRTRLDWLLNPIIHSAAEILVSDERKKVKACADSACGWLFIDVSRNRSRRWCDMQDCGNRAKATRFYKKKIKDDSRKDARTQRRQGKQARGFTQLECWNAGILEKWALASGS